MTEPIQTYVGLHPWKLYFDGSKHKKGIGVGILLISPQGIRTRFKFKIKGFCSNNEAEYEALIAGLEIILELGAKNVAIRGDSELVIKQLSKEYKCTKENLLMYFVRANYLLGKFDDVSFKHVPRINKSRRSQ